MIVEINNLTKTFGKNTIFKNLNISVPDNSFTCIHGESGSGKTTLLNTIGLIEKIEKGQLILFGKEMKSPNNRTSILIRRKEISYLFQNFGLVDDETIDYNLNIALTYKKMNKKDKKDKKIEALRAVNIDHNLKKKIYQLSGGEKQRIAFAKILLKKSKLILADEPTGSLDEKNKNEILMLLKNEQKKGKTVILVSHDDSIIEMSDNRIYLTKE